MSDVSELRARIERLEAEALADRHVLAMLVAVLHAQGVNGRPLVGWLADVASNPEGLARVGVLRADAAVFRQQARMMLELILDVENAPKPTHEGSASRQ